jgi:hypothetical protein
MDRISEISMTVTLSQLRNAKWLHPTGDWSGVPGVNMVPKTSETWPNCPLRSDLD